VNVASRLEGAAKVYGTRTLVSAATLEAAGDVVVARELDLLVVKGKTLPVRVFELLGPKGFQVPPALAQFSEGLALYRARKFSEAVVLFSKLPEDPPSRVFLRRSETYLRQPPPVDWAGVHVLGRD
jgi:adenylate cyclase